MKDFDKSLWEEKRLVFVEGGVGPATKRAQESSKEAKEKVKGKEKLTWRERIGNFFTNWGKESRQGTQEEAAESLELSNDEKAMVADIVKIILDGKIEGLKVDGEVTYHDLVNSFDKVPLLEDVEVQKAEKIKKFLDYDEGKHEKLIEYGNLLIKEQIDNAFKEKNYDIGALKYVYEKVKISATGGQIQIIDNEAFKKRYEWAVKNKEKLDNSINLLGSIDKMNLKERAASWPVIQKIISGKMLDNFPETSYKDLFGNFEKFFKGSDFKGLKESGEWGKLKEGMEWKDDNGPIKSLSRQFTGAVENAFKEILGEKYDKEKVKKMNPKFKITIDKTADKPEMVKIVIDEDKFRQNYEKAEAAEWTPEKKREDAKKGFIGMLIGMALKNDKIEKEKVKAASEGRELSYLDQLKIKVTDEEWDQVVDGNHWTSLVYSLMAYVTNGEAYPWALEMSGSYGGWGEYIEKMKDSKWGKGLAGAAEGAGLMLAGDGSKNYELTTSEAVMARMKSETPDKKEPYVVGEKGLKLQNALDYKAGGKYSAIKIEVEKGKGLVRFGKKAAGIYMNGKVQLEGVKHLKDGVYMMPVNAIPKNTAFPPKTKLTLLTQAEFDSEIGSATAATEATTTTEKPEAKPEEKAE